MWKKKKISRAVARYVRYRTNLTSELNVIA